MPGSFLTAFGFNPPDFNLSEPLLGLNISLTVMPDLDKD
jgi:hypothetical protein